MTNSFSGGSISISFIYFTGTQAIAFLKLSENVTTRLKALELKKAKAKYLRSGFEMIIQMPPKNGKSKLLFFVKELD